VTAPWSCNAHPQGTTTSRRPGGVSESAGKEAGGSNPFANIPSCRDGERHPGCRKGGALRGASTERRPRSVRHVSRVSPRRRWRADDSGCPEDAEEGNVVGMRSQSACTRSRREIVTREDASFARSFDPCASILTLHPAKSLVVRRSSRHHGWANPGDREEPALGSARMGARGSPRVTASARERRGTSEKEGGRGLRPCEDCRARVWLPARRVSLQKSVGGVGPQISSANALQKERSGSSERGSSPERKSARENVGCPRRAKKTS